MAIPKHSWILCLKLFTALFLLTTCKKEKANCLRKTPLTNQNHLIDISPLNEAPQLNDTLEKYPNLQVYRLFNDELTIGIHCHVFYRGLIVLTGDYLIFKSKKFNFIEVFEPPVYDTIPVSLKPTLDYEDAIRIAKNKTEFNMMCIYYRLGIFDVNAGNGFSAKDYRLVWEIQGEGGSPKVVINAANGEILK